MYEKTLSRRTVYEGHILNVDVLEVELENGRRSVREIIQHGVAVAVIAKLPDNRFVFIRQFRKAMERICFEVGAGNLDHGGEEEADTAVGELKEETGFIAENMEFLGPIYPSVGYCTERIDVFYCDVTDRGDTAFDDDERIETVFVTESELDRMIRDGNISDSKTLSAWMLYKLKKSLFLET